MASYYDEKTIRDLEEGRMPRADTADSERPDPEHWRNVGYPGLCNWMSSSRNLFIHRNFNSLNARTILHMQCEIAEYERRLELIDARYKEKDQAGRNDSLAREADPTGERQYVLINLRQLLKEYNDFILSYSQIRSKPQAEKTQFKNFRNWFDDYPHAIIEQDEALFQREDVVALIPQAKSWLRLLFDEFSPRLLAKFFPQRKQTQLQKETEGTFYWSDKGINVCISFMVVGFGLLVLIGPLWWLNYAVGITAKLGIITGFLVFFAFVLASATVDRPFEVLIGTAAYAAVLMVYVQQQPSMPLMPPSSPSLMLG